MIHYNDYIYKVLPRKPQFLFTNHNETHLFVEASSFMETLTFLKNDENCRYTTLIDLTVIHHVGEAANSEKYELIYNLTSMEFNKRLSLSVFINGLDIFHTIVPLYNNAEWLEREAYDMFGIHFLGNIDLRRLLTDYGFEGNPLKKDFPLSGFTEMRYSEIQKRVIYESVSLSQKSREFTYISPWNSQ